MMQPMQNPWMANQPDLQQLLGLMGQQQPQPTMGGGGMNAQPNIAELMMMMGGTAPALGGMVPDTGFSSKQPTPKEMREYLKSARSNPYADLLYGMNPNNLNIHASPIGMTIQDRTKQDPNYRGFRMSMASGRGLGESLKELPYDIRRGFQGKNAIGTAAGAAVGGLMGKNSTEKALGATGGAIGSALGTMIPIPFVGQAVGGLIGSTAGKLLGGLFGGDDEEKAKKEAERKQQLMQLHENLGRIANMYSGKR